MVGQVLARKSIQRLLRALFLITLVLVGSTRSHPTNTLVKDEEFIKARCSPSCEESDFSACYQKLLSVGDALADLKSFGRAADYHKQLVTLAAAHKIQDERVILGLLSVAEDLKKGGELEEADQTLAYAHFVLTSQVQAHSATSTQAKLEKAILLLQSEILDCQGDAVGALVKHEQALRHNASGNRMAVHDALKHVDLLWNVLNEPRHRIASSTSDSLPSEVKTMLQVTLAEKVQLLKARAGNNTLSFTQHIQLPQKMLPGVPSQPIWGKSARGVVALESIAGKLESSPRDKLQVDKIFHAIQNQAQMIADVLRPVHEQLLLESQSLMEAGLLQLDDECIVDTRSENSGSWFRYEPTRPRLEQEMDSHGCASTTPTLCEVIQLLHEQCPLMVVRVGYSLVQPNTWIRPHFGVTNGQLKVHYGLKVPLLDDRPCVHLQVASSETTWTEQEVLIFDDSFRHDVWSDCNEDRIVVQVAFVHPSIQERAVQVNR